MSATSPASLVSRAAADDVVLVLDHHLDEPGLRQRVEKGEGRAALVHAVEADPPAHPQVAEQPPHERHLRGQPVAARVRA